MHWYVKVHNQAYGPYSDAQMQAFVVEGRVNDTSLISNAPQSGFFPACEYEAYGLWSGTISPQIAVNAAPQYAPIQQASPQSTAQPVTKPVVQPAEPPNAQTQPVYPTHKLSPYQSPYQAPNDQTPAGQPSAPTPGTSSAIYLIMAEIRSNGEIAFLKALQGFGKAQRIGDAVWLVRSSHSGEQLRNTLSQTLNQQDRLFVMVSDRDTPAWFNIGADLDHRIRELWDEDVS